MKKNNNNDDNRKSPFWGDLGGPLFKYTITNIGRKPLQTSSCIAVIFFSALIILSHYTLLNSIEQELKKGINEAISGELILYNVEDNKINILESQLSEQQAININNDEIKQFNTKHPETRANRRIRLGSLVSYGEETSYTNFHALEDDHLVRLSHKLDMLQGVMPRKSGEVVISETLAADLLCRVGDTLLLLANNINDYMTDATATVSGIFREKGLAVFLGYNAFMTYDFGQEIAEVPAGQLLELIINPIDGEEFTAHQVEAIRSYFAQIAPQATLATWQQTVPLMSAIVRVWGGGGIITRVVFISFSLIILITLTSLIVRSRRKEIGTLLAIGFSWTKIKLLLCSEYMLITLCAVTLSYLLLRTMLVTLCGTGIEVASEHMQWALMTDTLYPATRLGNYLYVTMLFLATTTLSVLISIKKLQKGKIHTLINN